MNENDLALAKIGMIALIDEVTGYQQHRDKGELMKIFNNLCPDDEFKKVMNFSFLDNLCRVLNININNPNDIASNGKKIHNFLRDMLSHRNSLGGSVSEFMTSMDVIIKLSHNKKQFMDYLDRYTKSTKEYRKH